MYGDRSILKKIAVYIAGPAVNLVLALIFQLFFSISIELREKIVYTNLLLALFNLIPIIPLDGGRILKEILVKFIGNKNAVIFMNNLSKVILIIITFLYSIAILKLQNIAIFLLIVYLWYLKYFEDKKVRILLRAYEVVERNRILTIV